MANIITLSTGTTAVNRPLTYTEFDANFINLNAAINSIGSTYSRTSITATAGQTTFTATYNPSYIQVYVNGVLLNSADYTATNGTTIVLATAVGVNTVLEVVSFTVGANVNIGIGSQNIDGGVPGSIYTGIITKITGGIPTSAVLEPGTPVNTVAPVITGTAQVGQTLTVSTGTWTGTPTPTYTYQWQQYTVDSIYINIIGATNSSYTLTTSDQGLAGIRCIVTATNSSGIVSVPTQNTSAVILGSGAPVNTVAPAITGTAQVGQTLTVSTGTWTGTPTPTYTYRWQRNNITGITGATSSTYTLVSADQNSTISCIVTATNSSGIVAATSASTATVIPLPVYDVGVIPTSINEGASGTFNVITANVSDGTTLYWTINHTTTSDADFSAVSGSFTITSNQGSFNISPVADATTEGAETFTVSIRTGSVSGPVKYTTASVTINDTSLTPTATGNAIFAYGVKTPGVSTNISNLVSTTGVVATDTTGVGTSRSDLAAANYGIDKGIFGYGGGPTNITNLVSNTGTISTDTTGVGTARSNLAAAGYGSDKAIFGFGLGSASVILNLVSNTGVVATDTTGSGTPRYGLAAAGYGTDKAIFGYGADNPSTFYSMTNKVSNTGIVASDTTGVARARLGLGAAGYGGDKAIFAYGYNGGYLSVNNLVSNTGVVAAENFGAGSLRAYVAAAGYGGDKAIFGYGTTSPGTSYLSETNKVSNTGTVSSNTTGVGTARYSLAAAGF
jgi:hypothetical protein